MSFVKIKPEKVDFNVFQKIRYDWLLITSGTKESFNSMTACWGGFGHLWDIHHTCFIFVRPARFTFDFLENYDNFTIQLFSSEYKDKLHYFGSNSGRDVDKVYNTNFHPKFSSNYIYYEESKIVFKCKKIYFQDIDKNNFLDDTITDWYSNNFPEHGYHRMYVGSIEEVLIKQE